MELATPSQIKSHLDSHVIGQNNAKRIQAVGVHNHYKRLKQNRNLDLK